MPNEATPTLVLPPRYSDDSIRLWRTAVARGWNIERLQGWRAPEALRGQHVALYGEPLFVTAVAQQLDLTMVEPPLDWLTQLPFELTGRRIEFTDYASAQRVRMPTFIKPANEKSFVAQVYASGHELPAHVEPQTEVLLSEPVQWSVEFRCFVLDRKVKTLSPYWRGEVTAQAQDGSWPASETELQTAQTFAGRVLAHHAPASAVVLDVGIIEGFGWAVIEANPAFGAGIYGCDCDAVLDVIAKATESSGRESSRPVATS